MRLTPAVLRIFAVPLALVLLCLAAFWPVLGSQFIGYDDNFYVTDCREVKAGLTAAGFRWAFTTFHAFNWHPLTWLSHMLDVQIFGLWAGGHHLMNLLIHLANVLILFFLLRRLTGTIWRSAAVAAFFAWHPLHVESVAWVSERKDVLSTLFWWLSIAAYAAYLSRPRARRYLLLVMVFALGLMAKPMLVTLPFVLLILDGWPLGRWLPPGRAPGKNLRVLIREKAPLFLLSGASAVVTYLAQAGGAVSSLESVPFPARLANAVVSYGRYIGKMLWPARLAFFYPHPLERLPLRLTASVALLLAGITLLLLVTARRRPYLLAGWLWYLGTLLPVIGLVQVGLQSMADRYTYLPLTGLFIMAAWGLPEAAARVRWGREVLVAASGAVLVVLLVLTRVQAGYWRDNFRLFGHAVAAVPDNWVAYTNLGAAYHYQGNYAEAIRFYRRALEIKPDFPSAHYQMGNTLHAAGDIQGAVEHYREAIRLKPHYVEALTNLGISLLDLGRTEEGLYQMERALAINPDFARARFNLGDALRDQGKIDQAIEHYRAGLRQVPDYAEGHNLLGMVLAGQGRYTEAEAAYRRALQLDPGLVLAHNNLGAALFQQGRLKEAEESYLRALRLEPGNSTARLNLGLALSRQGRVREAEEQYRRAVRQEQPSAGQPGGGP